MRPVAVRLVAGLAAFVILLGVTPSSAPGAGLYGGLPRRGTLGVATADTKDGVAVTAILPGSAGGAAGLRTGDVLISVDGAPVTANRDFLPKLRQPAGHSIALGVLRGRLAARFVRPSRRARLGTLRRTVQRCDHRLAV